MSDTATRMLDSARRMHADAMRSIRRYAERARLSDSEAMREAWLTEAKMEHGGLIATSVLIGLYGTHDDKLACMSADNESRFLRYWYARTK